MHGIILEDRLQYRIEVHLASINTDPKELVGETGLVQNFYSKIKLARGLQVIDEVVAERLDIIRLLRNAAAHAHVDLTFDHLTISSAIDHVVHPSKTTSEDRHIAYAARTTYLGWDAESDGKWYRTVDHLLKLREFAASVPVEPSQA